MKANVSSIPASIRSSEAVECRFRTTAEDAARINAIAAAEGRTVQDLMMEAVNEALKLRGQESLKRVTRLQYRRRKR